LSIPSYQLSTPELDWPAHNILARTT
jgi:hypothetical protein